MTIGGHTALRLAEGSSRLAQGSLSKGGIFLMSYHSEDGEGSELSLQMNADIPLPAECLHLGIQSPKSAKTTERKDLQKQKKRKENQSSATIDSDVLVPDISKVLSLTNSNDLEAGIQIELETEDIDKEDGNEDDRTYKGAEAFLEGLETAPDFQTACPSRWS
ncbi:hypothetical protein BDP27DRAFT_1427879 [Rhodocollybia butyracea]|uniref:Uncharacterized protein n=1 Tax=Rhodocollybia butyracea TaxID=206335 RepID=A0A9P5PFY0_9AGAR|nr:hypothetical protein BDP27DRAFT_1427879 [Rhodocollybia butyracea]